MILIAARGVSVANVFISYSRIDIAFARRLFDALAAAGRHAWVDWEGIPPTAQWLQEIFTAIDGADTFVILLSPDSVASAVCAQEVAHAVQNRKRIIPIVCRDVTTAAVKAVEGLAPLAALNWIFMRATDSLDKAFTDITFALDTNLTYWHLSSRLLVRAKEWEAAKRNTNLALRGSELTEAETWLTEGADIEPRPSALQIAYITASRRGATSRQRRLAGALITASTVFLVLSIISLQLFRTANAAQQLDTQQRNGAIARQLALASTVALNNDQLALALLLSTEATKIEANSLTRDALLENLTDNPHISSIFHSSSQSMENVAVSPD